MPNSIRPLVLGLCASLVACAFKPDEKARPQLSVSSEDSRPQESASAEPPPPPPLLPPPPPLPPPPLPPASTPLLQEWVIEGTVQLGENSWVGAYDRVVFRSGAKLITNGQDLDLRTEELISDDGVILTFEEGAAAAPGQPGRSGGNIHIQAKKARGSLFISGRGEAGGSGIRGNDGAAGEAGAAGTPSNWEWTFMAKARGCLKQPGDGQPGQKGHAGGKGGDGASGGDSARVLLEVGDVSGFNLRYDVSGGKGGASGEGGNGGPGGRGGKAEAPYDVGFGPELNCQAAHDGAQGAPGDKGPPGREGPEGKSIPLLIRH